MPPPSGPIVLVDDEMELVQAVGAMLRAEFGDARVKATSVAQRALDWIKQEKPGVLITDVRMPQMSGLELIEKTQALWGSVPTIIITAFPSDEVSQATRNGSLLYLPKPFSFQSLLDCIRQLETRRPASFRGAITVSTLADLLQLYAISGSTGLMVVKSGKNRGEIWFERGQVVHSHTNEREGFDAFSSILSWPEGSFSWQTRRAEKQTIDMSVSELLLEAYRLQDEANQGAAGGLVETPPSFEASLSERNPAAPPLRDSWIPESFADEVVPDSSVVESARATSPTLVSASEVSPLFEPPPPVSVPVSTPAITPPAVPSPVSKRVSARPPISRPSAASPVVEGALERLATLDGFVGAALLDGGTSTMLGTRGGHALDLNEMAAGGLAVMQAKRKVLGELALDDVIEDILITLARQFHMIRPLRSRPDVFVYLVLDRQQSNLALARLTLTDVASSIQLG